MLCPTCEKTLLPHDPACGDAACPMRHRPLSGAERQARHRARTAARLAAITPPLAKPARPPTPFTRPTRWKIAVTTLASLLDEYEAWLERMPEAQRDGSTGEMLAELLELRSQVEDLATARLPKGFGRD